MPYPALWGVRKPESTEQPARFERTPDGEIVFHLGGLTDVIQALPRDLTAPAEARQIAFELFVQMTLGKSDTILLPADTDTIEISMGGDDGREWLSVALPPDLTIRIYLWDNA